MFPARDEVIECVPSAKAVSLLIELSDALIWMS